MKENGIYFGKESFYQLIRDVGGVWNDSKERPIVCLVKSTEDEHLYWAIPLGNLGHRTQKAKDRIRFYTSLPQDDIRSCYYHVGRTDVTSIFFISDAVPITDKYIEREYIGKYTRNQYVIQNSILIRELNRKLQRILSWENSNPNSFRQHITDIKNHLIQELDTKEEVAEQGVKVIKKTHKVRKLNLKDTIKTPVCFRDNTYIEKLKVIKCRKL